MPVCRKCNGSKSDFDTPVKPIINLAEEDPEDPLTYEYLVMCPISESVDREKAKATIEVRNLNSPRLYETRSQLLSALTGYVDVLREKVALITEVDTPQKKKSHNNQSIELA